MQKAHTKNLYEKDFELWCRNQAKALKDGTFEHLDTKNLIEEIESLGRLEKRALKSYLLIITIHLLKLEYQPDYGNKESWVTSIRNCRIQIEGILEQNPSFKNLLNKFARDVWDKGRAQFSQETGVATNKVRKTPYTVVKLLGEQNGH